LTRKSKPIASHEFAMQKSGLPPEYFWGHLQTEEFWRKQNKTPLWLSERLSYSHDVSVKAGHGTPSSNSVFIVLYL